MMLLCALFVRRQAPGERSLRSLGELLPPRVPRANIGANPNGFARFIPPSPLQESVSLRAARFPGLRP